MIFRQEYDAADSGLITADHLISGVLVSKMIQLSGSHLLSRAPTW